ncbi:MAG: CotH kinase family protein [Clostridia bacterium]|nr:CotH kinase family protein [Clostridia bacterium]
MNRKKETLLAAIVALACLLVLTVVYSSPFEPVVQPVVDIEKIWAIEDARVESDVPLVTELENHGAPLAYERNENTFYCTLGMGNEEAWPDIHLTAQNVREGVQLVFVDDYKYDWCADAIRDGYPYQVMAYTDEAFWYFDIVFTSLPIVVLEADETITAHEDVPVDVSVSWQGEEPLDAFARAHRRGATSLNKTAKNGFKVEFTRGETGPRTQADVPFLGATDEMTLIACSIDPLMIRDRLSWDMYNEFMDEDEAFGDLDSRYVELFLGEDYHGVYLMLKQYDYAQEMALEEAGAALTDSCYRTVDGVILNPERPVILDHLGHSYEQHYAPAGEDDFQSLRPYLKMIALEDDAAFSRRVMELMDLDSVIRYALFIEACGMTDNEFNNLNIWAHHGEDGLEYRFVPWDLDVSWGLDDGRDAEIWYSFDLFNRMLRLDCGGVVRQRTLEIWQELRETAFTQENMDEFMARYDEALNGSGAFYRNAVRWEKSHEMLDTYEIYSYALSRFDMMDRRIAEIAGEEYKGRQIWVDHYETRDLGALTARQMGL